MCLWQSIKLKLMIRTKKNLWHDLLHKRITVTLRRDALIRYKILRREIRKRIKIDIRKYETNVDLNSKLHPIMLYKYNKDKLNVKDFYTSS